MWIKSAISKMSKTFILHNNDAEKLLTNWLKNNWWMNNQVTDPFSI